MEKISDTSISDSQWSEFQDKVQGQVILPNNESYGEARLAWNLSVDQHPAVIVIPQDGADVATAVQFAWQANLGIAVQSTGHGVVRPANGAMLILTTAMQDVQIDPINQTARIAAGVKWGKVLQLAQEHGLAPLLGSSPEVGVMGYTLGGGFGWLGRKYGMAIDSVNFFEVVTADGQQIVVSENEHPDLFWGMRGGGGSLALVTAMEIKLYQVNTVYAGNLYYPIEMARDVFTHYRDWANSAPDELTCSIVIMNYPPMPQMPEFLRGKSFVQIRGCYCGPMEDGEMLLRHWRDWRAPIVDDFKEIPFSAAATISNDPVDPLPGLSSGAWVRELTDHLIETIIPLADGTQGSPLIFTEIRHAGGAITRMDQGQNAYGNRDAAHLLQTITLTPTREIYEAMLNYDNKLKEALQPDLTGGVYPSFLEGIQARERIGHAYTPEAYKRLRELKARYDPDNRFGYSYQILPAD